jgi:hypothetical protein
MTPESRNGAVREAPRKRPLVGRGISTYAFQLSGSPLYIISGGTAEKTLLPAVPLLLAYIPCVCVSVCIPSIVAKQQLGKHDHLATNTHAIIEKELSHCFLFGPCHIKRK